MQNTLVENLEHLLDILYSELPDDNLIVFDKHSNGYCIDEVKVEENTIFLISYQEVIEVIDKHLSIMNILDILKGLDVNLNVEVLISISSEHNNLVNELNSELYLNI